MKLEIAFLRRIPSRIYADATWKLEGKKLIETVPIKLGNDIVFTLNPGDNIRLDGKVYHVTKHELAEEETMFGRVIHFVYEIKKGRYKPPEWLQIGEVQKK